MSTNRVAAPWQRARADRYLVRRGAESDVTVAAVLPGPAGTFSTRTIPPPLVERRERGCLGATLGLMALGVALVAAAVGVGVWL